MSPVAQASSFKATMKLTYVCYAKVGYVSSPNLI